MTDLSTPRRGPPTGVAPCTCCGTTGTPGTRLVHDATGHEIDVCLRCIRSSMRMKADNGDQRGRLLLQDYAQEYAWHVWRSDHVLYLLPPIAPFAVVTAATAMQTAPLPTRG